MNFLTAPFENYPIVFISLAIAILAGTLVYFIRKYVPIQSLKIHHEVGFTIFLQIGVIYGVLLAFIFSITWDQFSTTEKNISIESSNLVAIYELTVALPADVQEKIRATVKQYIQDVIKYEWPDMKLGRLNHRATRDFGQLLEIYAHYTPKTTTEHIFYTQTLTHLANIREYRSMRIFQLQNPRMIRLIALIVGLGSIVLAISFFFGMEVIWVQGILTAAMAITIATIIGMILLFTQPFNGPLAIEPTVFNSALQTIDDFNTAHPLPNSPA